MAPINNPRPIAPSFSKNNRRAFDSADAARQEFLLSWSLQPGASWKHGWTESAEEEEEEREAEMKKDDGFGTRMDNVRRRLLGVLGVDRKAAEVRAIISQEPLL